MSPTTETTAPAKELGFSVSQGVNWSNYIAYRPIYPLSFFNRIFEYHAQKPGAAWSTAHDIGAGCGVVSSALASRFSCVIVSDPNDGYIALARKLLVEEAQIPESKFKFLQEAAEASTVKSGTVDLITACECIHWTSVDQAINEFSRQLNAGGTLAITYYTVPRIAGNKRAQKSWKKIWGIYIKASRGDLFENAALVVNTGLEYVGFPDEAWDAVKRTYINANETIETFMLDDRIGKSRVREGEERIWAEDEDWHDVQDFEWLKGYLLTWVSPLSESDLQDLLDELESALKGEKVKIETPLAMVFATRV